MTEIDNSKIYIQYAQDIINHKITSCKAIYQLCKRFLSWFDMPDRYFDYEDVDRKIKFVSKLKHFTGEHANKNFILLPWQQFAFAGVFGFKKLETHRRIIKKVFIFISRKNGKSALCAALALATLLVDNEPGAEIDVVANTSRQANILFEMCKNFSESCDPKGKIFQRYRSTIKVPMTKSIIQVHSSDSMTLDGWNTSVGIFDEIHAAKNWDLYNVIQSSQAMRTQPLMICLTTAGSLIGEEYPCYSMYTTYKKVLSGVLQDDSVFPMIYELDEGDDYKNKENWLKCCPSLGQTVLYDYIEEQITLAKNSVGQEAGIKTKTFNMFVQSSNIWLPHDFVKGKMQKINLHDYEGEDCFIGIDFSMWNDLSCFCVLIPPNEDRKLNPDKFIFKVFIFIPQQAMEDSPNRIMYKRWVNSGFAKTTPGNAIDTLEVLRNILEISEYLNIVDMAYDQYYGLDFSIHAEEEGLPLTKHNQSLGAFTPSTNFFEIIMRKNEVILDDNPVLLWMFGNVEMMYNEKNNTKKPGKANGDKNNKIDGIITILESITAYNADRGKSYGTVWSITEKNIQ